MLLTPRRWQILALTCVILIIVGVMLWLGQSPWSAIIGGVQDASKPKSTPTQPETPAPKPDAQVPKPDPTPKPDTPVMIPGPDATVPAPAVLSPTARLGNAVANLVPQSATAVEVRRVASVFRDMAKAATRPAASPQQILDLTSDGLSRVLGDNRNAWVPFGAGLAKELEQIKLDQTGDFQQPWNQIADALERVGSGRAQ